MQRVDAVVFDLGGVLVKLEGLPNFMSLLAPNLAPEAFHQLWLHSAAVRAHEGGKMDVVAFLDAFQKEVGTKLPQDSLLKAFYGFITEPYDAAIPLLKKLRGRIPVAMLSNTSAAHWTDINTRYPEIAKEMQLFLSYEMGLLKPDLACFQFVVDSLGYQAENIIFFDDNPTNVAAAKKIGLSAYRVNGAAEAALLLESLGVI